MTIKEKPLFEEVYSYAKGKVKYFISKIAYHLPLEQKEEIEQNAMLRTWTAYQNLDAEQGWKSFIQLHCRGAVLDYLKGGDRDIEAELDMSRFEITSESTGQVLDVEEVAGIMPPSLEIPDLETNELTPNWPLLSRMAGKDEDLHIICKLLQGHSQDAISEQYTSRTGHAISRERIAQKTYEFLHKLDSPLFINDPWINQCIFALGLCEKFHMDNYDNGIGWDLEPLNLFSEDSFKTVNEFYTPSLFGMMTM